MAFQVPVAVRMRLRGTALARVYARCHALMYVLSRGRLGARLHVAAGAPPPVLLLTTTGRRTGKARTTPLIYLRDGGDLVVAAANAGHPHHPGWWRNLESEPRAIVQIGDRRQAVVGREVKGMRRDALWRRLVAMYDGLEVYQVDSARRIPIVALTPAGGGRAG